MKHSRSVHARRVSGRLALVGVLTAGLVGLGLAPAQAETSPQSPRDQRVVVVAARAGDKGSPTVVADASEPRSYEFATTVPAGSTLRPAQAGAANARVTGDILVAGPTGATAGAFDGAWAQDAKGRPVATSYAITGTRLIQTVVLDAATVYPVTLNAPIYSSIAASPSPAGPGTARTAASAPTATSTAPATTVTTATSLPFVAVPGNYVYNPALGALHDYCTDAPDEFPAPFAPNANFRGPCARHDLCYEAHVAGKSACDNGLNTDMYTNCDYQYGVFSALRSPCHATADVYWAAVVVAGGY
ncbi:phospholipase A2 [Pengzhenrongella sp.]|uniref:phospholipase A2 n=1 Tax=Pengzhenrongella sp. TaxID=2888820 RepID=UPI002F9394A5